jgi:hypothetical protein
MVAGAETSQLHLFSIPNLFCITVTPFYRNIRVGIGIDEDIERAIAI